MIGASGPSSEQTHHMAFAARPPRRREEDDMAKAIPEGFHTLSPHLVVKDASQAIDFYKRAFGAEEMARMTGPDGKGVMHCELKISDSRLMLADEFPSMGSVGPQALGGSPVTLHLYVQDADALF